MKYFSFILGVIMMCILSACSEKEEHEMTGSIYGVVTVAETAEPMRATGVELYKDDSGALLLKTVTYDDGHFEFKDLQPGYYELVVDAEGYDKDSYNVEVEIGRTARADMQLKKTETYMDLITVGVAGQQSGSEVYFLGLCKDNYSSYYCTECGFIYGQNSNLTIENGTTIKTQQVYNQNGYNMIVEVSLGKGTWYVMAYAKNRVGYEFGNIISFEITGDPEVETLDVSNITDSTATLNGLITYAGDPQYTEKGFVYSNSFPSPTIDDPETATTKVVVSGTSKEFSANIAELTKGKKYYVRAYAKGSTNVVYGESVTFIADESKPYIVIGTLAIQLEDLSKGASWDDAKSICAKSRVGGFSDWRLPTRGELSFIYANSSKIGGFEKKWYWTSEATSYYNDPYALNFSTGSIDYWSKSSSYCVRAVRSVQ